MDPLGVLEVVNARRARRAPKPLLGRELGVGSSFLVVEMLFDLGGIALRAVENPVFLPFVEMLEALEQQDETGGDTHGERAPFGNDRHGDGKNHHGDLRSLIGAPVAVPFRSYQSICALSRSHNGGSLAGAARSAFLVAISSAFLLCTELNYIP